MFKFFLIFILLFNYLSFSKDCADIYENQEFATIEELINVLIKEDISIKALLKRRHEFNIKYGIRLHSKPHIFYKDHWQYLMSKVSRKKTFLTYKKFKTLMKERKIRSERKFQEIIRKLEKEEGVSLPYDPRKYYKNEWEGGNKVYYKEPLYPSFKYLKELMVIEEVRSLIEYGDRRIEIQNKYDILLPVDPRSHYKGKWKGWPDFLSKPPMPSYKRAKELMVIEGVGGFAEYDNRKDEIENKYGISLPAILPQYYAGKWKGAHAFFVQKPPMASYEYAKELMAIERIKNHIEYRDRKDEIENKYNTRLPAKLSSYYKDKWEGASKFFNYQRLVSYKKFKELMREYFIGSFGEYKENRLIIEALEVLDGVNLPHNPETVYKDQWEGAAKVFAR